MQLTVACVQLTSGSNMEENIATITDLVTQAAARGATFITTPENSFMMDEPHSQRVHYTQEDHPGIIASAALAKKLSIWLLIGSVAITNKGESKSYNRCFLFNPAGDIVTTYDKIHLFDADVAGDRQYRESDRFIGSNKAVVAEVDGVKVGLTICYDVRFAHLYRSLAKQGARIITVPAAFTKVTGEAHWHVLLRARAIENGCYIIAAAQTGTHPGDRKTFGHSLIVDPWGRVIEDGGTGIGITVATIDLGEVEKTRARLPSLAHDRDYTI